MRPADTLLRSEAMPPLPPCWRRRCYHYPPHRRKLGSGDLPFLSRFNIAECAPPHPSGKNHQCVGDDVGIVHVSISKRNQFFPDRSVAPPGLRHSRDQELYRLKTRVLQSMFSRYSVVETLNQCIADEGFWTYDGFRSVMETVSRSQAGLNIT
ncbi:hypothetical protein TNCV_4379651 [Trichonephila clavipes]|nr:hypothetical protein TNCV_4379651 [Trichonephila clavipes]